jgi:hypothetical protein
MNDTHPVRLRGQAKLLSMTPAPHLPLPTLIADIISSDLNQPLSTLVLEIPLFPLVPLVPLVRPQFAGEITSLVPIVIKLRAIRGHPLISRLKFMGSVPISTIPNSFQSPLDETDIALVHGDASVMEISIATWGPLGKHALMALTLHLTLTLTHWVLEKWFIATKLIAALVIIVEILGAGIESWLPVLSADQTARAHRSPVRFDLLHSRAFDVVQQILVFLGFSRIDQPKGAVLQRPSKGIILMLNCASEQRLAFLNQRLKPLILRQSKVIEVIP